MPEGLLQRTNPRLGARLSSVLVTLRRQLQELYGERLVKLLLYGSQARGDATPWSDVDLLVVLKGRVRPSEEITRTGGIVSGVCLEYDAVIQCLFMDEERFRGSGSPLLRNVSREAIEV
jgi:predicted nucleotidyltransferase